VSTSTRDRIVHEAIRLFGEDGFRGTSVARIEQAAGLSPGAGGLYHHFRSKEALLVACLDWHLERITALREMRARLTPTGDVRAELQVMARYVLAELDQQQELFRVLATEARARPELLTEALGRLLGSSFSEFASWLHEQAGDAIDSSRAKSLAAVGLGSLMWFRLQPILFGVAPNDVDDEQFITTWVATMLAAIAPNSSRDWPSEKGSKHVGE
jgi:AcrR family transcriptional regulator